MHFSPSTAADGCSFQRRWSDYYRAVEGRPPRETLLNALDRFEAESSQEKGPLAIRNAVDLGCGDGRDTVELLRRNWRVLVIDGEPEAIARLRQRQDINRRYLETRVQAFENIVLPPDVDLINASFSLPFCLPNHFADLWEEITVALKPGGRFCGHLFGDRDSWAAYTDVTHHTRQQVEALLHPFEVELLDEEEHPGRTALGEEKHWHLFNIVARRR
ncbi:class I SAM-dependent methyltransferase [Nodosilinea nodulosa]|uniref:class I SAM-dependent methyltransferase n=1 Tax=Nodosilinea nodulosa TaxID=416001 RepID=UPI0003128B9B|nr:class I SAM-dependent methyltransferase [Nodosilinea nodulosa]